MTTSDGSKNIENAILYHDGCYDGFGAAWAAWKKFGEDAIYIPTHYSTPFPDEVRGKTVYLVDFNYPLDRMREFKKIAKRVVVIDHHIGNKDSLPEADEYLFDINHSGAFLSWQYFHPNIAAPKLMLYVEDKDLWTFVIPESRPIHQALESYPMDFKVWDKIAGELETPEGQEKYLSEGNTLIRRTEKLVGEMVKRAEEISFEGYQCLMVNSSTAVDEIGNALVQKKPPIGIVWSRRGNRITVSLRGDGTVDLSVVAKTYGGGGHPKAAAFSWEEENFLKLRKSEK